ncbi:MAG: chloride channel protein [Pseudomonadota bacterium]|nr:chloride channel protein [Pseudomonadota bacterium]
MDRLTGWLAAIVNDLRRLARSEHFILSFLAVALGILAAYGSIVFRLGIGLVQKFAFDSESERLFSAANQLAWWQIMLAPALGGLVVGLFVHFVMPGRRNQGVSDVIEAGALHDGRMPLWAGIGAALASATSIGFGASVGREGPVVHLGATLSSWIARQFRFGHSTALTLLGCGVASAVAASFNAPIAGVFFALEVVVGTYALAAFTPVVIASVTGTIIARIHLGDFPAFVVPEFGIVSFFEFPAFVLLGLISAVAAGVFMWSIMATEDRVKGIPVPAWLRPVFGGLAVGVIAVFFPQVLGVGYEATDMALNVTLPLWLLLALVIAKTAATAISLGTGFAGGVFSPSLYVGAMVGGAFGIVAGSVLPDFASSPGTYTIVGMGAVAAAVLGAPISTILVVFEITGDYGVTIAVMVAVAVATIVTQQIPGTSFFHWQLARRGIDIGHDRARELLQAIPVRDAMEPATGLIPATLSKAELRTRFRETPRGVFFVVADHDRLVGAITLNDVKHLVFDDGHSGPIDVQALARAHNAAVLADDNVERAHAVMDEQGVDQLPVVDDAAMRRMVGIVRRKSMLRAHNRVLARYGVQ